MNKILTLVLSIVFFILNAQENCGTYISEEGMQAFYQRDISHLYNNLKVGNIVDIPITYHLTRENNGSGGFQLIDLFRLHCELNASYQAAEIHFYIKDIIFHNNSSYHHMTSGAGSSMMNNENDPTSCNVFIVEEAKSGSTPVCGYSFVPIFYPGPNRGGIVLDIGCSGQGSGTLPHEMGHYLNLPHTFYGWEGQDYDLDPIPTYQWEKVDGSNCTTTGDGFCDTPPDYISDRWSCAVPKTFLDPNGQSFNVDEKNYMSYSLDGCQVYFKQDQMDEMKNAPASYRSYLLSDPVPNLSPLADVNLVSPIIPSFSFSPDTVGLFWDANPNADYYLVQLSLNNFSSIYMEELVSTNSLQVFNLNANATFYWRVKPISLKSSCNNFTSSSFKTATFNVSVSKDDVLCSGSTDGNAYATDYNQINGVVYKWYEYNASTNNYQFKTTTSTNVIHNLAVNDYYVEVIKISGESSISHFSIGEPTPLHLDLVLNSNGTAIQSIVSGGTPPYNYFWSNGTDFEINSSPDEGYNRLFLSDNNGCFLADTFDFKTEGDNVAIKERFSSNFFNSFNTSTNPNNSNVFNIEFNAKVGLKMNIQVVSIDGKIVHEEQENISIGENNLNIDLNKLQSGIYLFTFYVENELFTKRILIQ